MKDLSPTYHAEAFRKFVENQNWLDSEVFPLRNVTIEQAKAVIDKLDAEQSGWDANFFNELGMVDIDCAWDFLIPTCAKMFPQLLKAGYSVEDFAE